MDRLINEVAAELGVSKTLVKNVYKHLFLSVHNTMKRGEYQNILLNGFGKFVVKPTRKKYLDELYRKNGSKNTATHEKDSVEPTVATEMA